MARSTSTPRGNSGPGRDTPRTRTAARPSNRASRQRSAATQPDPAPQAREEGVAAAAAAIVPGLTRGFTATKRLVAMLVIAAVLLISYASSLRIYLSQERQMADTRQQITARQQNISSLQDEINRWQDPAYVKAQARERLGWVLPGEVGYRVIGADGKPLGGGSQIDRDGALPSDEHATTWWERMWGSVRAADDPVPVQSEKTVTPPPTPSAARSSARR